ncbi:MAG TPA: phosphoribosyltransferase [Pyrinomonadaceae bacterium]|nr:phosphoribosyltransferase [Pyrinomonadaceae bacterium]
MKELDVNFKDRQEAGQILANKLSNYAKQNVIVLGLPRGGVPVAFEVAKALKATLDVYVVRKLGVPGHEELAMGAIASGDVRILNKPAIADLLISEEEIEAETRKEREELKRRELLYRDDRPPLDVTNRTVILVDDGIATGSTIKAAIAALKKQKAGRIVVAVPVAPASTIEEIKGDVDEVICVSSPEFFYAISLWYDEFPQTSDEEVRELLKKAEMKEETAVAV